MTPATALTNRILVRCGELWPNTVRLWRTNAGSGIGMSVVHQAVACLESGAYQQALRLLQRPVSFGVTGGTDLTGFFMKDGSPRLLCVEVKIGKDKLRPSQVEFHSFLREFRVPIVIARELEQAITDIGIFAGEPASLPKPGEK